jgi:hypothetical protein
LLGDVQIGLYGAAVCVGLVNVGICKLAAIESRISHGTNGETEIVGPSADVLSTKHGHAAVDSKLWEIISANPFPSTSPVISSMVMTVDQSVS